MNAQVDLNEAHKLLEQPEAVALEQVLPVEGRADQPIVVTVQDEDEDEVVVS